MKLLRHLRMIYDVPLLVLWWTTRTFIDLLAGLLLIPGLLLLYASDGMERWRPQPRAR